MLHYVYVLHARFIYHRGDVLTHTFKLSYTYIHLSSQQIGIFY